MNTKTLTKNGYYVQRTDENTFGIYTKPTQRKARYIIFLEENINLYVLTGGTVGSFRIVISSLGYPELWAKIAQSDNNLDDAVSIVEHFLTYNTEE